MHRAGCIGAIRKGCPLALPLLLYALGDRAGLAELVVDVLVATVDVVEADDLGGALGFRGSNAIAGERGTAVGGRRNEFYAIT